MAETITGTPDREPSREYDLMVFKELIVEFVGMDSGEITEGTQLDKIFPDSLALTEGVMAVEDRYGMKIKETMLAVEDPEVSGGKRTVQTVGEILDVISRVRQQRATGEGEAA